MLIVSQTHPIIIALMSEEFKGATIVVAGGSTGIGLNLVRKLNSFGATVHVLSRTMGELQPGEATHHSIDFAKEELEESHLPDKIHGVAYCPGTINLRSFRALKIEDFRHDLEVNLVGAIKFLKACFPRLKKNATINPASVVLFSTVAVGKGLSMHSSVAASKGAIEGLTRALAAEWAPQIRVNCIAPALTDTPLAANLFSTDEKRAAMQAKYPLGRTGKPQDIASMAKFLLTPENSWITGQVLAVDGGMSTLGG